MFWGCIRVILGLYWDNGKQTGNYYLGSRDAGRNPKGAPACIVLDWGLHTYAYIYIYTHAHIRVYIHIYTDICIYACIYVRNVYACNAMQ